MTFNEANYGSSTYRAVSDRLDHIERVIKIWLEDHLIMNKVRINGSYPDLWTDDREYKNRVWEKIREALITVESEPLEISFWDDINWSENTIRITVEYIEKI